MGLVPPVDPRDDVGTQPTGGCQFRSKEIIMPQDLSTIGGQIDYLVNGDVNTDVVGTVGEALDIIFNG